jgi:hypothetical protein
MIKTPFDPDAFGRRIAREIYTKPLTHRQAERLKAARLAALSHAGVHAHAGVLADMGGWLHRHLMDAQHMRRTAAFVLLFGIAVAAWWQMQPDVGSDDDVDAMLLADDLPPDAYLSDQLDKLTERQQQGS